MSKAKMTAFENGAGWHQKFGPVRLGVPSRVYPPILIKSDPYVPVAPRHESLPRATTPSTRSRYHPCSIDWRVLASLGSKSSTYALTRTPGDPGPLVAPSERCAQRHSPSVPGRTLGCGGRPKATLSRETRSLVSRGKKPLVGRHVSETEVASTACGVLCADHRAHLAIWRLLIKPADPIFTLQVTLLDPLSAVVCTRRLYVKAVHSSTFYTITLS